MKLLKTQINDLLNSNITVVERDEPFFKAPFHSHPELELVYIKESYGKQVIGNTISYFEPGDIVFVGANLPHVWLNDEVFYKEFSQLRARSIVVYFNKEVFYNAFQNLVEADKILDFFNRALRGIRVRSKATYPISLKLEKLLKKDGFEKILGLLEILHILSLSKKVEYLTPASYLSRPIDTSIDRLAPIFKHTTENFKETISLNFLAKIINLTPQSFCRLFKKRTGKHYTEYLNEVRISNACKYLLETDWNISEIAYTCGFKNISNFNKIFKEITGTNPKKYRENLVKLQDISSFQINR
jgi:AraC-like DNA-binding protein